jgi:hypothetical protein
VEFVKRFEGGDTKPDRMSRTEVQDLIKVVRMRAKVRREDIDTEAAAVIARIEKQLAARYEKNHPAWEVLVREAEAKVNEVDAHIAERCKAMGILPQFRPGICLSWYGRGENADQERRAELRRVAQAEVEASVKRARSALLRSELEQVTKLTAAGLTSAEAQEILATLPAVEQLLPNLSLEDLERKHPLLADQNEAEDRTIQ